MRPVSNENCIQGFLHCSMCLKEVPKGQSPAEYQKLAIGWTSVGLQVWCRRHDVNVMHIDFQGHQHPANQTAFVPEVH